VAEGKTSLSVNLALTVSEDTDRKVALVDCDFRKPNVGRCLGMAQAEGLGEVIDRKREIMQVLVRPIEARGNLQVLPAGRLDSEITPEVYTKGLPPVLEKLRGVSDLVILDTPPILPIADHDFLSDLVDAVLLVVRAEKTRKALLKAAMESMDRKRLKGVIVNGVSDKGLGYQYYYYR
jgi:Mrp family chromosome partitioning ATPase